MKYVFSLLFYCLMLIGCSENIPSEQEQMYLNTTDSLLRYKHHSYMKGILEKSDEMRDHLVLSFDEFKEKYNLTDGEMEMADAIYGTHIYMARSLQSRDSNQ